MLASERPPKPDWTGVEKKKVVQEGWKRGEMGSAIGCSVQMSGILTWRF